MCVSLQRRAIPHFKIHVLLQRRTQKCMNQAQEARGNTRHTKITILPQFRTSDQHEVTRGLQNELQNSHFTSVLDDRWARNDDRVARRPRPIRISPQFWTSDEHETTRGLRRRSQKFAFHLSFGRPMSTKRREGCAATCKIRISPEFWTSDDHEVTRGWSPVLIDQTHPALKKKENFKEVLIHNHSQQIFSADFLQQIFFSRFSQQIFLADLLSRSSQQIFSADLLSRFFQQIFSADLLSRFSLSRFSQQIFSADFLSADFLSRSSQQIFSADLLSRSSQQIFSLSYHLLWSGVGGQLLSYHSYHLLWSGVGGQLLSYHLLWSGVGGQLLSYHVGGLYCMSSLEGPFRGAFGNNQKLNKMVNTYLYVYICFFNPFQTWFLLEWPGASFRRSLSRSISQKSRPSPKKQPGLLGWWSIYGGQFGGSWCKSRYL